MRIALIGVDWGTSNSRAWAFDPTGEAVACRTSDDGIATIRDGGFAAVLRRLVGDWTTGDIPIVLGGMIGSRQGWLEAPYLPCPALPAGLSAQAVRLDTGIGPGWILPGLSFVPAAGAPDVMRGEEIQILGTGVLDGVVVLPGTHSKWVDMRQGAIRRFRTFMTGELFAVLRKHSLLGRMFQAGPPDWTAFDSGLDRALTDPALTSILFGVRTEGLFGRIAASSLEDYLSGLLIGAEIAGQDRAAKVSVVGEAPLVGRYVRALQHVGFADPVIVDGQEAAAAGLWRIGRDIIRRNE